MSSSSLNAWWIIGFPIFWLGIGRKYPFSMLGEMGTAVGAITWSVLTAGWMAGFFWKPKIGWLRWFPAWGAASLVLTPLFDVMQWVKFAPLGYLKPTGLLAWDVAVVAVGVFLWARSRQREQVFLEAAFIFSVAVAVGHQWISIAYFPTAPLRSDMLTTIRMANQNFFAGMSAYSAKIEGVRFGLGYLPGMWLSYAPLSLSSFDLRWLNGAWLAVIGGTVFAMAKTMGRAHRAFALSFATLWFLNPYLHFRHDLYLHFFWWIALVTTFLCMNRRGGAAALFAMGISCVTMTWAWIMAPFWILMHARNWKELSRDTLAVVGITAAVCGYFYVREGHYFAEGMSAHFQMAREGLVNVDFALGFSSLVAFLGWVGPVSIVQKVGLVAGGVAALLAWRDSRSDRTSTIAKIGAATFFGFCFLIEHSENYQYLLPLLCVIPFEARRRDFRA